MPGARADVDIRGRNTDRIGGQAPNCRARTGTRTRTRTRTRGKTWNKARWEAGAGAPQSGVFVCRTARPCEHGVRPTSQCHARRRTHAPSAAVNSPA